MSAGNAEFVPCVGETSLAIGKSICQTRDIGKQLLIREVRYSQVTLQDANFGLLKFDTVMLALLSDSRRPEFRVEQVLRGLDGIFG